MDGIDYTRQPYTDVGLPLIALLCGEAGVCLTGETYGNQVEIHTATYNVIDGLIVSGRDGVRYRLKVTPVRVSPEQSL